MENTPQSTSELEASTATLPSSGLQPGWSLAARTMRSPTSPTQSPSKWTTTRPGASTSIPTVATTTGAPLTSRFVVLTGLKPVTGWA